MDETPLGCSLEGHLGAESARSPAHPESGSPNEPGISERFSNTGTIIESCMNFGRCEFPDTLCDQSVPEVAVGSKIACRDALNVWVAWQINGICDDGSGGIGGSGRIRKN